MKILGMLNKSGKLKAGIKVLGMLKRFDGMLRASGTRGGTGAADDPNNPSRLKGSYCASSAVIPSGFDMLSLSDRAVPVTPLNVLDLMHPTTLRRNLPSR